MTNVEVKVNREKGEELAEADMKTALGKYAGGEMGEEGKECDP